jgi:redox-sensitive bicupin YhaK (pirin superfamily)
MPKLEHFPARERGLTERDWLDSRHTFSFGEYYDPRKISFGTLRVLNEDRVAGGRGFPLHAHDNMEIITIVLKGSLEHKDNLGNQGVLNAGDVQRMTAGKGIKHSEMNASKTDAVHFLQIWIFPSSQDLTPSYEQKSFPIEHFFNRLAPIVSNKKSPDSLFIHQESSLFLGSWGEPTHCKFNLSPVRGFFVFVLQGEVSVCGESLKSGDALGISETQEVDFSPQAGSKILFIDVALSTL